MNDPADGGLWHPFIKIKDLTIIPKGHKKNLVMK
jgi:hypothetical protein